MTAWTQSPEAIEHLEERIRRPRRISFIVGASVLAAGVAARAFLLPVLTRGWSVHARVEAGGWSIIALLAVPSLAINFGDFLRWRGGVRCPACNAVLGCLPTSYRRLDVQRRMGRIVAATCGNCHTALYEEPDPAARLAPEVVRAPLRKYLGLSAQAPRLATSPRVIESEPRRAPAALPTIAELLRRQTEIDGSMTAGIVLFLVALMATSVAANVDPRSVLPSEWTASHHAAWETAFRISGLPVIAASIWWMFSARRRRALALGLTCPSCGAPIVFHTGGANRVHGNSKLEVYLYRHRAFCANCKAKIVSDEPPKGWDDMFDDPALLPTSGLMSPLNRGAVVSGGATLLCIVLAAASVPSPIVFRPATWLFVAAMPLSAMLILGQRRRDAASPD